MQRTLSCPILPLYTLATDPLVSAPSVAELLNPLQAQYRHQAFVEVAGLFWLAAELAILYAVLLTRRHLNTSPLPAELYLTRHDRRRARLFLVFLAALALVVFGRHLVIPTLHQALPSLLSLPPERLFRTVQRLSYRQAHVCAAIWILLVTLWVILETLIAYHGWRAYTRLCKLLPDLPTSQTRLGDPRRSTIHIALLIGAALLSLICPTLATAAGAGQPDPCQAALAAQACLHAHLADAPIRNAVYLYLRLAGIVWVIVEWIAAWVLWRTYRLLAPRFNAQEPRS